ncbi:hypothetical protein C3F34_01595 [Acinetobacter sp. ACNIH2]|uniref:hypothetical protein n=1 Tax=Acinetobacter sp. ACNIH2 TaxID=1758189 RepID=UPI000CDC09CB|nr:hypothetical protein [Acinetobacter sp. ACNIH2]AUX84892.1 hypothetical protein C3F34_01595 [Acinetobacter sp. ACNIH2]
MSNNKQTDAPQFIADLSGGNFAQQLGIAISEVAQGVVANGKKGKVQVTIDVSHIGESNQVNISHTLAYVEPTAKGKRSEDTTSETPMYLNNDGSVTIFANHTKQLYEQFDKA